MQGSMDASMNINLARQWRSRETRRIVKIKQFDDFVVIL